MKVGFYAPLKSPGHAVPSGDRQMARLLIKALAASGHEVEILSSLRSWEGTGSQQAQEKIYQQAQSEVKRLVQQFRTTHCPPALIFTYHVYHKAPDWIGGALARELQIPYVIAEASIASKQIGGGWDMGHQQSMKCIQDSQSIIAFNPVDIECLQPLLNPTQSIELLDPFLGKSPPQSVRLPALKEKISKYNKLDKDKVWLITVAMMREGDKLASYKQLAETLKMINTDAWQLLVIGDGFAFDQVKDYFRAVESNCRFFGKLEQPTIYELLLLSDIFVWPAVNEAYGFALLEALSAGLPAVVQDYGGVSTIVGHEQTGYVTNPARPIEFNQALVKLIDDADLREKMHKQAKIKFTTRHSFNIAAGKIDALCNRVVDKNAIGKISSKN